MVVCLRLRFYGKISSVFSRSIILALPCILGLVSVSFGTDSTASAVRGRLCNAFPDDVDEQFAFLAIKTDSNTVYATCRCDDACETAKSVQKMIGADVVLSGHWSNADFYYNRRLLRKFLQIGSMADMTILSPPARDAYDVPLLSESMPRLDDIDTCGPRKVCGRVIARWGSDRFLVRQPDGDAVKVQLRNQTQPALGASVEAVGKLATDLYRFNLVQAQWRETKCPAAGSDAPEHLRIKQLFFYEGRRTINTYVHGRLFRVRGTLKSVLSDETGYRRFMIEQDRFQLVVDCTALPKVTDRLREGCELEVMGICVMYSENWHAEMAFPRVSGIFLVPRTADDIRVLRPPPWWTPARFTAAVFGFLALLTAILIWNASLRVLVARKSRALLREQAKRLSETLKIDERTRLAAELHDFHSQNLTAVAYRLSSARNICERDPSKTRELLATAANMLKSCRTDLRRCLWDLRNDALDEPDFAKAIRETVAPVAGTAYVSVRFAGHRSQISDSTAHALLSILRELTANAVVHGHAAAVRIAGERRLQTIRFSVQDDGCGFDVSTRLGQDEGHFGIDGIRERLNRLSGSLDIESAPGRGTYVRLTVNPA